jgi:isopentenyl diphosphate isomerase/L-lactate dehydrogenase-like FMN-dependent dehydrogenase
MSTVSTKHFEFDSDVGGIVFCNSVDALGQPVAIPAGVTSITLRNSETGEVLLSKDVTVAASPVAYSAVVRLTSDELKSSPSPRMGYDLYYTPSGTNGTLGTTVKLLRGFIVITCATAF